MKQGKAGIWFHNVWKIGGSISYLAEGSRNPPNVLRPQKVLVVDVALWNSNVWFITTRRYFYLMVLILFTVHL